MVSWTWTRKIVEWVTGPPGNVKRMSQLARPRAQRDVSPT
jgi:hypothetical protein